MREAWGRVPGGEGDLDSGGFQVLVVTARSDWEERAGQMKVGVRGYRGSSSPYVTQLLLEVIPPGTTASWRQLLSL